MSHATGTQTDRTLDVGESHLQQWTSQWWSHQNQTWSNSFAQVVRPRPDDTLEVVQYLGVYRLNQDWSGAAPGLTSEGHARIENREDLAGANVVYTQNRHEWSWVSNGSRTDHYDSSYHQTDTTVAQARAGRFGLIEGGALDVELDFGAPFRILGDRLAGFMVSVTWEWRNLTMDWVDPYQSPPELTGWRKYYYAYGDFVGQRVVLPFVDQERLIGHGRFGTGLLDDLIVTGLLVTDIVGYFDPTPVSDVLNAGLNAADGNYTQAGISLAGALLPGAVNKAGQLASKVGGKISNGLGSVARSISRHTACDAPTWVGRAVGSLLGRCFVGDTLVGIDEAVATQVSNVWLITAGGILLVSPVAYAAVMSRKRKEERTIDDVFADDAWCPEPLRDADDTDCVASDEGEYFSSGSIDKLCEQLFHGPDEDQPIEPNSHTFSSLPMPKLDNEQNVLTVD